MEEKKIRKGYSTIQKQVEATKRYRNTEAGKEKTKISNYKSYTKKYILKLANIEDLTIVESWIQERKAKEN